MSRAAGGRGLRREAPILLPASLLLFAMLASVTLLSYRAAVARFATEREQATLKLAGALTDVVRLAKGDDIVAFARWLPPGAGLALYDGRGTILASFGLAGDESLDLAASALNGLASPRLEGFAERSTLRGEEFPTLRVFVPFARREQRLLLRLEVPEPALFAQQRSLRILTPVVFGLSITVALLAIFFMRALIRPYEELLEKARAVAPAKPDADGETSTRGSSDEIEQLLATFDRALAALRSESAAAESSIHHHPAGALEPSDELSAVERTLGPQLESGLLMFDRLGKLVAANPAAVELLGAPTPSAGDPAAPIAAAALAAQPELAAVLSSAIAAGRSIARASVAIDRDGHKLELGLTLQALRGAPRGEARPGADANAGGFLVLLADVTDLTRRESEERFAAGLTQLGELSAGVAHELRNSLATVQGYLSLAARRELPPAAREEIAEAQNEAKALARVVDDFLTFARPGSGTLEPVDLQQLLSRATNDPALAGVAVELQLPASPLPSLRGDPLLLQRTLRNLLLNAVQATLARAARDAVAPEPVIVALRRESDEAVITIDDRGTGLPPGIRASLFEPFVTGRPEGAGLGLALAHRIVRMHGGRIALHPREPSGVRAEVHLPLGQSVTSSSD